MLALRQSETSGWELFYGGQFTLSTLSIILNYHVTTLPPQLIVPRFLHSKVIDLLIYIFVAKISQINWCPQCLTKQRSIFLSFHPPILFLHTVTNMCWSSGNKLFWIQTVDFYNKHSTIQFNYLWKRTLIRSHAAYAVFFSTNSVLLFHFTSPHGLVSRCLPGSEPPSCIWTSNIKGCFPAFPQAL